MPKTVRGVFYEKLTFDALINAHQRAKEGKGNKREVLKWELDLETNTMNLLEKIKKREYRPGKYRIFVIKEPKERIIKSLPYVDRVVHQWYVYEFIKPYFLSRFIYDSHACIENKGTHKAALAVQSKMRQMKSKVDSYYIIKCDIKKYFYTIDKKILFNILFKRLKDQGLLAFSRLIIFDDNEEKGIPIGNYTSQYFANIYLNELDYYVKHELKVKKYVRFMDDFVILMKTKEEAKEVFNLIEQFLDEKLCLKLNAKSRIYPRKMGVDFCGYRIFETHKLLRVRSKRKIKKKINRWKELYNNGKLDIHQMMQQWNSWSAHAAHANCYNLKKKLRKKVFLINKGIKAK